MMEEEEDLDEDEVGRPGCSKGDDTFREVDRLIMLVIAMTN